MKHEYRINPDWQRLASRIVLPNQRVLVIGPTDAGKSTFCQFLIDFARKESLTAVLIDSDIGQSQIGPPTTIGMKLYEPTSNHEGHQNVPLLNKEQQNPESITVDNDEINKKDRPADALYFVGSITPQYNLLPLLTGTRLMLDAALEAGANFTVIDTTGYVDGKPAVTLKQQKIDIVRPHHIVCIGRSKELESIVGCYKNLNSLTIHHLLPHKLATIKSSQARKKNRTAKFDEYFSKSALQIIPFTEIRCARTTFLSGRIANRKELEILTQLTEEEAIYAEWGHHSVHLITKRKLPLFATNKIKNHLSLSYVVNHTPIHFEHRLVGMLNETGRTLAIGIIENIDFKKQELNIRCEPKIASKTKLLQFGDYRLTADS